MLNVPCPKGRAYDPEQIEAVEFIDRTPGNVFVCDEMGKGKTVSTIAWLNYRRINRGLIICKANGVAVWEQHLKDWHMQNPTTVEYHPDLPFFEADFLIMHYYWLSYKECAGQILKHFPYNVIILDELHTLRHAGSKRAKHLYAKNGVVNKSKKAIVATGTPLFNKPIGMYPMLKGIRPEIIDGMTKHDFGLKYCAGYEDPDGKWQYNGASNIEELSRKMSKFMIRRTEADSPSGLPPLLTPKVVYLNDTKERSTLVKEIEAFDDGFTIDRNIYNDDDEELATLRRLLGESKVKQAARYILKSLRTEAKLVVYAYHRSVVKELHKILSKHVDCIKLIGGVSRKKAAAEIKRFQAAGKKIKMIIVASVTAFSDSITLTKAIRPIFVELSYIWNDNKQGIYRILRRGRKLPVEPVFLCYRDSYDQRLLKINKDKIKTDKAFERGRAA